ncbi:acetyl-CoA carboxylase biotin carboxyl carrier protein [Candidatus Sumerlaeota bacterium]|nr:acetyl-CoA carboxylase biotin carboxyl carrier protein [Candidatus Sumerlaeota bacterium]
MNIEDIRALARLVQETGLSELEIEEKGLRVRISGPRPVEIQTVQAMPPALPMAPAPVAAEAPARPPQASAPERAPIPKADEIPPHWKEITSPIVGTFYRSPAPDADPFVQVGDTVKSDTVLCIVEAMKLMNEIKAEMSGVVKKIMVENAQPVEFGQPMFLIEPL